MTVWNNMSSADKCSLESLLHPTECCVTTFFRSIFILSVNLTTEILFFNRCKQNCGEKICPSKRFSLVGTCFEGCIGRLIYEWRVYKNVGNDSIKSWELQQNIAQSLAEVKDTTGPIFTLPKDMLHGGSEYLIRLYGRRARGVNGKTESVYVTNEVPQGGACFGWPPSGDALITNFHIWCEGWKDPDMPLSYQFYYKNDEGKLVLFYFGHNNFTYSELPLGNPTQNYTLEIIAKVLDFYKGEAKYSLFLQARI